MAHPIDYLNPSTLSQPRGFTHVTVAPADRIIFISGQVAYGPDGRIVGAGDLAAQTRQVMINLKLALEAAGSSFDRVAKFTFFVKNLSESAVATIRDVRREFLVESALPASTMVGVPALAKDDLLLEVEAYAVR